MATAPILPQLPIEVLTECTALTRHGTECARFSNKGFLCAQHARLELGVKVGLSSIAGAGEGLFAAGRDFHKGDVICEHLGTHMTKAAFQSNPSMFGVQLYRGVLDARRTSDGFARYANAANTARQANAQLLTERKLIGRRGLGSRVFLQATKPIHDGEEILVKYGSGYWRGSGWAGAAHPL